jgi:hypothetical protein
VAVRAVCNPSWTQLTVKRWQKQNYEIVTSLLCHVILAYSSMCNKELSHSPATVPVSRVASQPVTALHMPFNHIRLAVFAGGRGLHHSPKCHVQLCARPSGRSHRP